MNACRVKTPFSDSLHVSSHNPKPALAAHVFDKLAVAGCWIARYAACNVCVLLRCGHGVELEACLLSGNAITTHVEQLSRR
jgi:hypothetical protein